jgi:hypothetical protein
VFLRYLLIFITSNKFNDISGAQEVQLLVRLHLIFDHVYIPSLHTTPNPVEVAIDRSSVRTGKQSQCLGG